MKYIKHVLKRASHGLHTGEGRPWRVTFGSSRSTGDTSRCNVLAVTVGIIVGSWGGSTVVQTVLLVAKVVGITSPLIVLLAV